MNVQNSKPGVWKSGKGKGKVTPKGRQFDDAALSDVKGLLADRPRRSDLLIEHLHLIQDAHGHLSATHLAALADGLDLVIEVEGDPILFNPYGVIPVNPETHPGVNIELADQFVEWLTSVETQELIGSFMVNGQTLFTPDSEQWRAAQ